MNLPIVGLKECPCVGASLFRLRVPCSFGGRTASYMNTSCIYHWDSVQFSSVQSLSHVRLFVTPWMAAHQASLSITNYLQGY